MTYEALTNKQYTTYQCFKAAFHAALGVLHETSPSDHETSHNG